MQKSKDYIRFEWDQFFMLWKQVNTVLRQKAEALIIDEAMEDWPEDEGFGSSDRWHVIFGKMNYPDFDEDKKLFLLPQTGEEMEVRVKRFVRDHCVNVKGDSAIMVDAFLSDPDGFAKMFAPA